MSDKRKKQVFYLVCAVILGVVHYFWGKPIFSFLATTLFYWSFAAAIVIIFADAVISLIKDKNVNFQLKMEKASSFVSDWEKEGNPLPRRCKKGEAVEAVSEEEKVESSVEDGVDVPEEEETPTE